jgi:hypothetical protein
MIYRSKMLAFQDLIGHVAVVEREDRGFRPARLSDRVDLATPVARAACRRDLNLPLSNRLDARVA